MLSFKMDIANVFSKNLQAYIYNTTLQSNILMHGRLSRLINQKSVWVVCVGQDRRGLLPLFDRTVQARERKRERHAAKGRESNPRPLQQ